MIERSETINAKYRMNGMNKIVILSFEEIKALIILITLWSYKF